MATSANFAPLVTLSDGNKMPMLGLGTWQTTNKKEMTDLLRNAFDLGYRHVDTAVLYGNESLIGESLRAIFSEGKYKREDIFIVTKLFLLPVQTLLKQSRNLFRIYKSSNLIFCMFILLVHPQKTTIGLGITSLYMFNGLN